MSLAKFELAYTLLPFKIVVMFIWVNWDGLACRSEAMSRDLGKQSGRSAFSYIKTTTVFKRKQGMSRASPVQQAIPANLGGSPLIESGTLRGQDVSFNNPLAVTRRRTSYALQEEKPRLISAQEIAQLSTLCTVLPIYNFASRDYLYLVANRYQLTYALR